MNAGVIKFNGSTIPDNFFPDKYVIEKSHGILILFYQKFSIKFVLENAYPRISEMKRSAMYPSSFLKYVTTAQARSGW